MKLETAKEEKTMRNKCVMAQLVTEQEKRFVFYTLAKEYKNIPS